MLCFDKDSFIILDQPHSKIKRVMIMNCWVMEQPQWKERAWSIVMHHTHLFNKWTVSAFQMLISVLSNKAVHVFEEVFGSSWSVLLEERTFSLSPCQSTTRQLPCVTKCQLLSCFSSQMNSISHFLPKAQNDFKQKWAFFFYNSVFMLFHVVLCSPIVSSRKHFPRLEFFNAP